ncbi:hypothetical protein VSS74_19235 [Conexibacter stalactiti]|uniref:WD40 repeat protein n=1 Tax=Conexibacter stalactiti TaxID=1940611 RepID=A0ABU4HUI5_9ACTN|nr:hypothetical protein [Conexibacter stalactiti]MDW5596489.1 hypothetical protein [Conexibacter stalactiti]MEC5037131.1 hypothetical protein [Conexibacter stalactiti]
MVAGVMLTTVPAQGAPAGRAYEMVSPPAKSNGGVVFGHRASDDGNALAFQMNAATGPGDGAFALTPYVSRRTPEGWVSNSAAPPIRAEHRGTSEVSAWAADFSDDFSEAIIQTNDPIDLADLEPVAGGDLGRGFDLYGFRPVERTARWISRPVPALAAEYGPGGASTAYAGRSRDGRHMFFTSARRLVPEAPLVGENLSIAYEAVDGQVRLAAVLPDGSPYGGWSLVPGTPFIASARGTQAISRDGSRIYWTTSADPVVDALYLREDGERTFVVSASQVSGEEGELRAGVFMGATRDGGTVYFNSPSSLTDDATGGGLYRWDRATEQLTFLHEGGGFDATAVLSERGDRLYFTTSSGADRDLYLWDESEDQLRHVAEIGQDTGLYADPRLRVSSDGRFAAFTSTHSLDPRHVRETVAVYRYDAGIDEVVCASCRPDGEPSRGPSELTASISRYAVLADARNVNPRNFAADGRLYFQTPDPLAPEDTNGALDVYEFDGDRPTLISSGRGDGSELVDNSDDGTSVFFTTADALVRRDTDGGYPDVYVARVGGGFPEGDAAAEGCQGDACQGPSSVAPVFPAAGSALAPDSDDRPPAAPRLRIVRPDARAVRRFAAVGELTLRLRATAGGAVTATANARIGRRQRVVARATSVVPAAGTVALRLRLSAAARRQLTARRVLRVRVSARITGAASDPSMLLTLRAGRR